MRPFNPLEEQNIRILTGENVKMAYLMPTQTGLGKSIMDATAPFRLFLREQGVHDYETQKQGPDHKQLVRSFIAKETRLLPCQASLYRPVTKNGDPRIWFTGLKNHAEPNDILGIFEFEKEFYVLNLTKLDIVAIMRQGTINPLADLIRNISRGANEIAQELLSKLKAISARGLIQGISTGDTAVGRTLESLLDIAPNSRKEPDYKGIELKSFRDKRKNRKTLFAKVPNWKLSKFKSSAEILDNFGYMRGDDCKLYCTVSALKPNSQGLLMKLDQEAAHLVECSKDLKIGDFAVWQLATLHSELKKKHRETFWIAAEANMFGGVEHFHFKKVEHTRSPIISQFDLLLERGIITLDHLIKKNSKGRVAEKGPFFKIRPEKLDLLFPPSLSYNLSDAT